jgi:glutathione S-transferase
MYESHTILKYIQESRGLAEHWYPLDLRKRAKVDEYLDWHHNGLRFGAGGYIFRKYVSPLTGKPAPQGAIQDSLMIFKRSLRIMERYWLKDTPYLNGAEPTLADISAACELAQTKAIKLFDSYPQEFPKAYTWLDRMLAIPEMKELHSTVIPYLSKFFSKLDE